MTTTKGTDIPRVLGVRLVSKAPSFVSTLFVGLFMLAVGVGAWLLKVNLDDEKESWILLAFAVVFGGLGVLVLWSAFRLFLSSSIPTTMVELSEQPFLLGQQAKVAIIQAGPAKLRRLRVNLICQKRAIIQLTRRSDTGSTTRTTTELLLTENLFEMSDLNVLRGDRRQEVKDFTLPARMSVPEVLSHETLLWQIEVWGTGYGLASFKEAFPIEVVKNEAERQALRKAYKDEDAG